ncbi:MAG: CBS domain-containing protein [Gammaproteobacteria bacterium]|nr:CBS domain-containing protein [Gammaproteobacteria bacterium]
MSRLNVPVEEFTTPDPVTATEDQSLGELRQLMGERGIRHLPVTRDGKVVGLISERDVRVASALNEEERHLVRASDIMAEDPVSVTASQPLDEVAFLMSERKIGSVIVNEEDGKLLGIFTATDALNALIEVLRRQA